MNLIQFREFFRKRSGRFDLVTSAYGDNGVDTFINAGQRYLDKLADIPAGIGRYFADVSAGDVLVKFTDCRAVLEVWCLGLDSNGDMTRLPLTKYSQKDLRGLDEKTLDEAYVKMFGSITQARPVYYTIAQLRLQESIGGGIGGFMDVLADGFQIYNGILLMPPSDGDYSIEIVGNFYSKTLSADTDSTYWTEQYPTILYAATMRELEIVHRNTEGRKDWETAIKESVMGIDMDGVNEDIAGISRMEG